MTTLEPVAWIFSPNTDNEVFLTLNKAHMNPCYWAETPLVALATAQALEAEAAIWRGKAETFGARCEELEARVAELEKHLREVIEQCRACEKELTNNYYGTAYCGESLPLTNARAALKGTSHE